MSRLGASNAYHNICFCEEIRKICSFRLTKVPYLIGLDKSGYQVISFLITQGKHKLWVLIRSASLSTSNEYPQHMLLSRNKKNMDTFWWKKAPYQELCYLEL